MGPSSSNVPSSSSNSNNTGGSMLINGDSFSTSNQLLPTSSFLGANHSNDDCEGEEAVGSKPLPIVDFAHLPSPMNSPPLTTPSSTTPSCRPMITVPSAKTVNTQNGARLSFAPVAPRLVAPGDVRTMEERKNEVVQEMVKRLRPFMNSDGQLRDDLDVESLMAVMAVETQFLPKTLLLTVLLNGVGSNGAKIYMCLASHGPLVGLLTTWLQDSIKMNSPLTTKLLELFLRLPLTVDQLVEQKLGKLVKKLVKEEEKASIIKSNLSPLHLEVEDKAKRLIEQWTALARQEDARRKGSSKDSLTTEKTTAKGKNIEYKKRASSLDDATILSPEAKVKALERSNSISSSGGLTTIDSPIAVTPPNTAASLSSAESHPHHHHLTKTVNTTTVLTAQRPNVVANMSLFNQTSDSSSSTTNSTIIPATVKSRAEQVLERVARGETSKMITRPLSADDIHRAKRRQMYLQQNQLQQAYSEGISSTSTEATPKGDDGRPETQSIPKKRVSFANEEDLVKIYIFEPESEEEEKNSEDQNDYYSSSSAIGKLGGHYHYNNAHEMEKNEASFAFKQMALVMEPEIDWYTPLRIKGVPLPGAIVLGEGSEERINEGIREKKALSAVYYNREDIPPSPMEALYEGMGRESMKGSTPKKIPLRDLEGRVSVVTRQVGLYEQKNGQDGLMAKASITEATTAPIPPISNDLLSSLLADPKALQDILKNVPSVNPADGNNEGHLSTGVTPPSLNNSGNRRESRDNRPLLWENSPQPTLNATHAPFAHQNHPPMRGPYHPPPLSMMSFPPHLADGQYYNPSHHPFPPSLPPLMRGNPGMASSAPPRVNLQGKAPCKYYRKGRPDSCRNGPNCSFYHAQ